MQFPLPHSEALSEILVSGRKRLGLSQRALSEQLGMSQQGYARIEKYPGSVALSTVLGVMKALGLALRVEEVAIRTLPSTKNLNVTLKKHLLREQEDGRRRDVDSPLPPDEAQKPQGLVD